MTAVIALGSNLGDREATLQRAMTDLAAVDGVMVTAVSGLVESHALKPEGVDAASPDYLNAIALVDTGLEPESLLGELQGIEAEHGRVRAEHWGDRTLDLDIVAVDGVTVQSARLTLPHPLAWTRAFVVVPWLQVQPDARLPGRGPIADLAAARSDGVWPYGAASGPPFAHAADSASLRARSLKDWTND